MASFSGGFPPRPGSSHTQLFSVTPGEEKESLKDLVSQQLQRPMHALLQGKGWRMSHHRGQRVLPPAREWRVELEGQHQSSLVKAKKGQGRQLRTPGDSPFQEDREDRRVQNRVPLGECLGFPAQAGATTGA